MDVRFRQLDVPTPPSKGLPLLRVYLLGAVEYEAIHSLQLRLVEEVVAGGTPALVLCEHRPLITVGRHGSSTHIELDLNHPTRRWRVRWVNRGGGCWLQQPGQLAVYPILPLDRCELQPVEYRTRLLAVLRAACAEYGVSAEARGPGLTLGNRPIACFGGAVRDWTTYHGAILNVNPDLSAFRHVHTGEGDGPMTSVQRECRRPFRLGHVRERLVELFLSTFGCSEALYFSSHPHLTRRASFHAAFAAR